MIKKKQTALFSLKIIYFYLILIIAIITLGLAGFCFYYYKNSLSNTKNIIHQLTSSAARQIDLQISSMDNLAQQLVSNKALIQTMGNLSNTEKRRPGNSFTENYVMANQLSTLLQQTCLPGPLMERISVAIDQGDYLAICSNYKFLDSNQEYNSYLYSDDFLSLYKTIKQKEIIKFTAFSQYDKWLPENNIPIISCYRPITDIYTFQIHGILEIQRPFTIIENILKNINYSHIQVYLFDDSNQMIYQNLNAQKAAPLTSDTIFDQNGVNTQFQQQYPFSDYSTIEGANWMNESDLLIMVGARVADRAVSQPDLITRNKVLVHIDVDPAEIGKNAGPSIPLVGDAKHIFQDFQKEEFDCNYEEWLTTLNEYRSTMEKKRTPNPDYVDPAAFITRLSEKMQEDGIYVADVGQNQIWSCGYHIVKKGKFLTSGGMGTMGYSIPAAMGAKTAAMDKQVIAVCGDGSFQMSMMELATIRQHNIPVKIIVLKNNYLGMVREYQHYTYKDHYSVVDLSGSPDLEKLSAAYDIPYLRLNNMEHVDEILDAFLAEDNTMLLECLIDPMDLVK